MDWLKANWKKVLRIIIIVLVCVIVIPFILFGSILTIKSCNDEVPSVGKIIPLIITTESMEDTINAGDLIFVKKATADEVNENDIISFWDPTNPKIIVTHRIEKKYESSGKIYFETKGDNNNTTDKYSVSEDALLGVYVSKIDNLGNVTMFLQSTDGLIYCLLLPLIVILTIDFIIRKRIDDKKDEEIKQLKEEVKSLKEKLEKNN